MDQNEWASEAITGLDVDVREDDDNNISRRSTKAKRAAAASKRPTSNNGSPSRKRKRPQKPKPPPAPPASLVALMKRDKSVLHFFTSLQENVTYDVDKWKHEAAHWKRIATSLPLPATKKIASKTKKVVNTKKGQRKSTQSQKKPGVSGSQNNDDEEGSTIPITDEALFAEFSDSDEEKNDSVLPDDLGNTHEQKKKAIHPTCSIVDASQSDTQTAPTTLMSNSRRSLILGKLIEAKRLLDLLGVSLVTAETKSMPSKEIADKESTSQLDLAAEDAENEESTFLEEGIFDKATNDVGAHSEMSPETIFHRRSDEKVVADMMASLRTLIEASSCIENHDGASEQQKYSPFYRRDKPHCPSVYFGAHKDDIEQSSSSWQHPASVGLKYLIEVLTVMNIYCHDSFDENVWNSIFEECIDLDNLSVEEITILKTGMKNRNQLVGMILSSLHVEITQTWANTERSSNFDSTIMHFYPTEITREENGCDEEENYTYSAKNFNRLLSLEEKIAHCRIATLLQRRLGDFQKATELVLGYVISSVPSLGVDQYHPMLPPAISMCVMESLLSPEDYDPSDKTSERNETWFSECIQSILQGHTNKCLPLLLKTVAFALRAAANIWKERCTSSDKRIRDFAIIESAAYNRLLQMANGKWLNIVGSEDDIMEDIREIAFVYNENNAVNKFCTDNLSSGELGLSCIISLITIGDAVEIIQSCKNMVLSLEKECADNTLRKQLVSLLPAYCFAYSSIMSKKWESIKLADSFSGRYTAAAFSIKNEFPSILEAAANIVVSSAISIPVHEEIDALVQCYKVFGDALRLFRFAKRVLSLLKTIDGSDDLVANSRRSMSRLMQSLLDAGSIVTVRVINLERRHDRMLDFMECAVKSERMLVMKAVGKLKPKRSVLNSKGTNPIRDEGDEHGGDFAFDGQCRKNELETKVADATRGNCVLSDFVKEEWKPSELNAFDKNAGSDFKDAYTTTSEKACALSHVASWFGVESSLSTLKACRGTDKVVELLSLSGFARGPSLLNENEGMDPTPVCVVLEDDAVLCDRFVERLDALLDELPRDFHFCSIGYSRPKLAPIIDYSPEIGVPSCLWYLTGYILSEEGARFLLSSLPIVGPVDSWIAVKMRDNFANRYGELLGIGRHARANHAPTTKDLSKIMKFRAFAAKTPLCTQKQAVAQSKGTRGGGTWRSAKKDSDVEYSGHQ